MYVAFVLDNDLCILKPKGSLLLSAKSVFKTRTPKMTFFLLSLPLSVLFSKVLEKRIIFENRILLYNVFY